MCTTAAPYSVRWDNDISNCVCTEVCTVPSPLNINISLRATGVQRYNMADRTHINILDDNSLLQIFSCYRLEDGDNWNLRCSWIRLTHVSQRWRFLIHNSSFHLDIYLLLKNNSPSIDTLNHLPSLPLVIGYSYGTEAIARKDQDDIQLGLLRHGQARKIAIRAPSSSLRILLNFMKNPFPRLEDLSLLSTTAEISLALPDKLHVPFLSRLSLHGIGLSRGLSSISSMISLSSLSLTDIRDSCYFPLKHLITQLQDLLFLEELSIGFAIPMPLPSSEGELLPAPILPVTLRALRWLTFRGVDVYIENFIAQINSPLLERLRLTLLFDLDFTLVYTTEFIRRTEGFEYLTAKVIFNKDCTSINMGHYEQRDIWKLSLRVNCLPLDCKIYSATQVCGALGNILFTVEDLGLDLDVDGMPSDWESTLDIMSWYELLLPFIGVKKLQIGSSLTSKLSRTLESVCGELVQGLLPALQELEVHLDINEAEIAFFTFLKTRESTGHPVRLKVSFASSILILIHSCRYSGSNSFCE